MFWSVNKQTSVSRRVMSEPLYMTSTLILMVSSLALLSHRITKLENNEKSNK